MAFSNFPYSQLKSLKKVTKYKQKKHWNKSMGPSEIESYFRFLLQKELGSFLGVYGHLNHRVHQQTEKSMKEKAHPSSGAAVEGVGFNKTMFVSTCGFDDFI